MLKLSVIGENDSGCFSDFLQTHIFRNFDHVSRIYDPINYRKFDLQKSYHDGRSAFFNVFFPKKTHALMSLRKLLALFWSVWIF